MKKDNNLKKEKATVGSKVGAFIGKRAKVFSIVLLVLCLALVGYIVITKINENNINKQLGEIDQIKSNLVEDSASLTDEQWTERFNTAKTALEQYVTKSGIVGVRANLTLGDILFTLEDYENALNAYETAAKAKKNSYTFSIAKNKVAVCYEQLGNFEKAADNYKLAADDKKYNRLYIHSLFNYGRVLEQQGNIDAANEVFQTIVDDNSAQYSSLAKSRIIANSVNK